jgi:hypothetical protein
VDFFNSENKNNERMIYPMQMTKKILSVVLAVMMVVSMMAVMGVSASALDASDATFEITKANGAVSYSNSLSLAQSSGTTVKLLKDFTSTSCPNCGSSMYKNSVVTLDLNGHTLSVNTTTERNYCLLVTLGCTLNVKNGTISMTPTAAAKSQGILVQNNSTLNLADDVDIVSNGVSAISVFSGSTLNTAADITANGDFAIVTNGTDTINEINITGGNITSDITAIYFPSKGTLNISGGTIEGSTGVYVKSGTTNITGGTIKGTGSDAGYTYNGNGANSTGNAIVVDNCGYPGGAPVVNVQGGSFESENADAVGSYANGASNDPVDEFITGGSFDGGVDNAYLASGVTSTTHGGVDYVGYDGIITDQATLTAACAAGGKYALAESFTSTGATIAAGKELELDLTDKTLTVNPWSFVNNGKLTVDGTTGKITASKGAIDNNGELVLKGGTVASTNGGTDVTIWNNANTGASIVIDGGTIDSNGFAINNEKGCSVTMNSGLITAGNTGIATSDKATINGGSIDADQFGITVWGSDAELTVNDGSISGGFAGISGNGSSGNQGYEINVNGGSVHGDEVGIYHPNFGTLNVNDGTIDGATGIYVKAGTTAVTSISGATVKGTGAATPYTYNGGGFNATGDAVVIDNCGYPGGTPNISISGGTFISNNAQDVASYVKQDDASQSGSYPRIGEVISGGSFSNPVPEELCAENYVPAPYNPSTKMYTVVVDDNPLNPLMAAGPVADSNAFGLTCDYLNGSLLGVQLKSAIQDADITSDSHQETGDDLRFVAVLDSDIINANDLEDYGFVLASVTSNKTTANVATKIDNLKANGGNGEKTVSCKNTANNVCGDQAYGDPTNHTTPYKYVTCAVNGLERGGNKVVARFYVKKGGKTYYAKYAQNNYTNGYTGAVAGIKANGTVY